MAIPAARIERLKIAYVSHRLIDPVTPWRVAEVRMHPPEVR